MLPEKKKKKKKGCLAELDSMWPGSHPHSGHVLPRPQRSPFFPPTSGLSGFYAKGREAPLELDS